MWEAERKPSGHPLHALLTVAPNRVWRREWCDKVGLGFRGLGYMGLETMRRWI
jgi:hypothetical protein